MLRLKKYLKPFLGGLLAALLLLFAQAMCDLKLPNFMSEIVNVGIQQNGVESGAPDAISANGMALMKAFMTDEEKTLVDSNYRLTELAADAALAKQYPKAEGAVYVLTPTDEAATDALSRAFGSATWTMINTMRTLAAQNGQSVTADSSEMNMKNVDMSKLYAMLPQLGMLPPQVIAEARAQALTLDDSMLEQSATVLAGSFYEELGVDMAKYQSAYILRVGGVMLLVALASGIATVLVSFISAKISSGVARNLRNDIYAKVGSFSNNEFDRFSTASLITRSTNDVFQIQMLLMMGIRMICYAPFMGIGGIIMAVEKSVSMSWIIAAAVVALVGMIMVIFALVMPKMKSMQKLVDRVNLVARETLNGLMVIRAFGTEDFEKKRFGQANSDLADTNLFINRVMSAMMPLMMLIMNGTCLVIIWVGAHQVAESTMQVGDMMAFMQYAMQIIMSFLMISMMFIFVPRAAVSAARIADLLETEPEIRDPEKPASILPENRGRVEFRGVSFRYHGADEDALHDISFVAEPGKTTAFIGPTGSGKTTLVNMIPRFYDVTRGEVLVDGADVRTLTQQELRSHIGYVPQKSILMSGTIDSNIRYGNPDASEEEVTEAARTAQAMEFISAKEEGFGTEIAQGGANVSGGQRQRLSIARALAVKPDIYIFDDSFSALDFKTDAALRAALREHTAESTVIIVAQRVSTIMNADCIYVLDDGAVIGSGTHRELLKSCPEYYEIASSQLSKEELEK